jgi:hypothetical protein
MLAPAACPIMELTTVLRSSASPVLGRVPNAAALSGGGDGLIVPAEHYYYIAVSFIVIIWAHGGSVKENNPPRHPSEEGIIAKGCLPEKKRK